MGAHGVVPVPTVELARFESLYEQAERTGDPSCIPWDHGRPNPSLVQWLDSVAPAILRCGCRVVVPGCGLGHDARELSQRGFDVTAFDWSPCAVRGAKARDPENAERYFRADLFELPARWVHRFDLVVEVNTLQSLPPVHRPALMQGLARLVGTCGAMLVVCRAAEAPVGADAGPPWPLAAEELRTLAEHEGLHTISLEPFTAGSPPSPRLRGHFARRL